jgi:hypothetical protein
MFWGYKRISKEFSKVIFAELLGDCRKSPKMAFSAISQGFLEDDSVCPLQVRGRHPNRSLLRQHPNIHRWRQRLRHCSSHIESRAYPNLPIQEQIGVQMSSSVAEV